ncbi:LysR family transcriptional regulator [Roseovarius phycicola]|uniref:LysR family transcriptional regulator n=1 Tax=Roseovarius phycicola TaxID=3080976 RepID=A0ABZ2HKZ4_9RHOB
MSKRMSTDTNLLKAMEVYVALVETGQMTAAAHLVGMTQSAASQHIANLERAYGTTLVDRTTRPLKPTQTGELMFHHAARVLNAVADLSSEMRHQGPHPISRLRVGMLASIATTLTVPLVKLAKDTFGVEDMTLRAGQSGDHETLLRTKQADIVISSNPFYDMDGLERHSVLQEAFLLVLPGDYAGPQDRLDDILTTLPLVRFADTTSVGRQTEQHLRRLKLNIPRVIQADRSSMVTSCVAQGLGFTLLTPSLLMDGFVEQMPLQVRPLPVAGLSRRITVVARDKELGSLPSHFAKSARRSMVDVIKAHMGQVGLDAVTAPEPA